MTPLAYYREQCSQGLFSEDQEQLLALEHLQRVYSQLLLAQQRRFGVFSALRKRRLVKGLYLFGGVGIGKTFLMDCFFHTLPFPQKKRMHFHQFMSLVHRELRAHQGEKDPLKKIAKKFAQKTILLCFDEFFVSDVTDAMLLGRLLEALFAEGVCLVATSNVAPDDLYKNGVQRQHFLPAIKLLKKNTEILGMTTLIDYRLRHLKHAGVFYIPNDEAAEDNMEKSFTLLAEGKVIHYEDLELYSRKIKIRKRVDDMVWFDFKVICGVPRSQEDYLAIAKTYATVFISDIPVINANAKDKISLFIRLVDVFYDARVRLVLSAETTMDKIYIKGRLLFEYTRACSRLLEMQSEDYFLK